jgi:hypothetical protein
MVREDRFHPPFYSTYVKSHFRQRSAHATTQCDAHLADRSILEGAKKEIRKGSEKRGLLCINTQVSEATQAVSVADCAYAWYGHRAPTRAFFRVRRMEKWV